MHDSPPTLRFHAHSIALKAAGISLDLARRVPAPLRSIADQLIRSASSVPANLAEGSGRSGRDRLHHFRIAFASALEADSQLRLLVEATAVDGDQAMHAIRLFDEVRAMTYRILHPKKSQLQKR